MRTIALLAVLGACAAKAPATSTQGPPPPPPPPPPPDQAKATPEKPVAAPDTHDDAGDPGEPSRAPGDAAVRTRGPATRVGQPLSQGNLDKAIIRRYIKRVIGKISECYEKELLAQPALEGSVKVQFEITADGKVGKSVGTGMAKVDACVAAVIQTIEFPKPAGGGSVQVNYPFTFRPAGE